MWGNVAENIDVRHDTSLVEHKKQNSGMGDRRSIAKALVRPLNT